MLYVGPFTFTLCLSTSLNHWGICCSWLSVENGKGVTSVLFWLEQKYIQWWDNSPMGLPFLTSFSDAWRSPLRILYCLTLEKKMAILYFCSVWTYLVEDSPSGLLSSFSVLQIHDGWNRNAGIALSFRLLKSVKSHMPAPIITLWQLKICTGWVKYTDFI